MGLPLRVLIVEDSADDADLALIELRRGNFEPIFHRVETHEAMNLALKESTWDVILADYSMPSFDAPQAFTLVKELGLDIPFIVVSGVVGEETSVAAMKMGMSDYVLKNRLARLVPVIERELRERGGREAKKRAADDVRKLNEQFREAQKMDAVGRLAGGVARDFNNLMSVILGYTSFLLDSVHPDDPMRTDLEQVERAAARAGGLTQQLLALSRQQVLNPRTVSINDLVWSMDESIRRIIRDDVVFTILGGPEVGNVFIDPDQMKDVITNLAINAREAMPSGGRLTIETQNVEIDDQYGASHHGVTTGSYVMIAITDTGAGMDAATQRRIFEPFFTTKPRGQGTGLGLSTVFGIIHQSQGQIWVYSEPGTGTSFKIYLPRTDEPVQSARQPLQLVTLRGTETILLVEDEEQIRTLMKAALRRNGYTVLDAQNGGEALMLCESYSGLIHLLMTDVIMPRMSGRDLAKRLAPIRPDMRVLYMSGYSEGSVFEHGVLETGVAYLQKPVTPALLARKVRELLDSAKPDP